MKRQSKKPRIEPSTDNSWAVVHLTQEIKIEAKSYSADFFMSQTEFPPSVKVLTDSDKTNGKRP